MCSRWLLQFLLKTDKQFGGELRAWLIGFRQRRAEKRSHTIDTRLTGCQFRWRMGDTSSLKLFDMVL
jgi:hypothetical protein